MDTQLTYEIVGGALGAIAILIGIIGASRQKSSAKKTQSLQSQLQSQVESLTQENKTYTEALMLAKAAVGDLEKQLGSSVDKLKMQETRGLTLKKTIATVRIESEQAKEQLDSLAAELENKEKSYTQKTEALKEQVATEKASLQETAIAKLTAAQATHKQEVAKLQQQIETLQAQLKGAANDSHTQLKKLQAELLNAQQAKSKVEKEQTQLHTQVKALQQQVDELTQQNESTQQDAKAQFEKQISQLKKEVTTAKEAKAELTAELKNELASARSRYETQQQASQVAQEKVLAELKAQISTLAQQKETLEQALTTQTGEQKSEETVLRSQIFDLESQLNDLAKANDQQSADLITQQIQPLREERDAARLAEQEAQTVVATLEAQVKDAIAAQKTQRKEQDTAEQRLNDVRSQLKVLEKQNESLTQAAQEAAGILPLKVEVRSLSEELTQAQKKLAEQHEASQKNITTRDQQIKTLKAEKASLEEAMKISQQVIEAMQKQAVGAQQAVAEKSTQQKSAGKHSKSQSNQAKESKAEQNTSKPSKPKENNAEKEKESTTKASGTEQVKSQPTDAPQATGSLADKIFVITGSLDQLTYEQITETVTSAGGRINKMPSSKTDYIVVGKNPGNKLKKAVKCNVPQLNESALIALFDSLD